MDVLVFATSVRQRRQVSRVQNLLTKIPAIAQWNFDLEDCDNILRVEAEDLSPRYIESLLQKAGIHCQELDY
ncbi:MULTISPECIES: hypothetical protein [Mucilaginibacter]|jgi:hypothetical protein|uniref:hypothetical protein n=1 Tax=Mucilaginibacter TaxID=423349 RepID=UPI0008715CC0|nr:MULTISPECIES: hypothetical protein [Mucilaginibacter]NVM62786.1 hypothetical protein [Mucilaginibacter sp. SG538B]WEA02788.1 hypothetical protein MusilaSJ_07565 [Mucilaginibacter sp. SJ]WPV02816.1 hypothetical protein SNE26_13595 [Mucilaginibacter gossypii]SCW40889.1 hypothetical protein SAMN03159284_00387 [Mucilaginibacter sp. NFR10]GGB09711.1 hypothetical protein GCM10011500_26900 [Mucilaginibacter rubeus]